jgi:hypothetical protein
MQRRGSPRDCCFAPMWRCVWGALRVRRNPFRRMPIVRWPLAKLLARGPPNCRSRRPERLRSGVGVPLNTDNATPAQRPSRYEPLDVPPFLPFWLGALLFAFVGGVLLSITLLFPLATHQQYRGPLKALPPVPLLQSAPKRDLQRYEGAKRRELNGSDGRLAIETAIRETAKQGWGPPK